MRRTAAATAFLALLLALLAAAYVQRAAGAPGESQEPIDNPDLDPGCGIDILVILDESGSIANAGATDDVRRAFRAFTGALANTGSSMAVSEFSTVARLPLPGAAQRAYTEVTTQSVNTIFTPYITNNFNPSGSTHWEDAFRVGRFFLPRPSADTPHLTLFITDGNPNRIVNLSQVTFDPGNPNVAQNEYELKVPLSDGETTSTSEDPAARRAVPNANALKAMGSHILTVAVGDGLNSPDSLRRIIDVSGPDVFSGTGTFDITTDDVYRVADFGDLEDAMRDAAFSLCAPSVNIKKSVDQNPDPNVEDLQPGQDWEMTATVAPPPVDWVLPPDGAGDTATDTTEADGFVHFQWTTAAPVSSTITVSEVVQDGFFYDPSATACTYQTPDITTDTPLPGFSVTATGFTGTVPDEAIVTCDMVNRIVPDPAIDIEKATNDEDADEPPGPFITPGTTVTWTYHVTNTGNVPLTGVTVTDDVLGPITCPAAINPLAVGEDVTCTRTGTAAAGQYENLGSVTARGASPTGQGTVTVEDEDPSHYFGATPGIQIEKFTNDDDADLPPGPFIPVGDDVTWTYVVTNVGVVTLTDVTVTDSVLGAVTCPADIDPLTPGEEVTCTVAGEAEEGQYANTGTVVGTTPDDVEVEDSDDSHYFGEIPDVDIEKFTNLVDADDPTGPLIPVGEPVTWTYVVTNTGNVTLTGWTVTDPDAPFVACPRLGLIAPGESVVCFSEAPGGAEVGQYANTGTVTATSPAGQEVTDSDDSHYFGVLGDIEVVKFVNGEDANLPPGPFIPVGGPVTWTYEVTNAGNTPLTGVAVVDLRPPPGVGPLDCPPTLNPLGVGETVICTATGTAEAGRHTNIAVARGDTAAGQTVRDFDPATYFGAAPGIHLEKHINGDDADSAPGPFVPVGGALNYEFIVTNTGNVALTGATVTDSVLGPITCPPAIDPLAVDEEVTCTATGTSVRGHHANIGRVTAQPPTGPALTDTDPAHYFGAVSRIHIEKFTNGRDADRPTGPIIRVGRGVTWTYHVTNSGNVLIKNLRVTDNRRPAPRFVGGDADRDTDLDPGEVWRYRAAGTARAGQYRNVGTVRGLDLLEQPVSDSDPSHYLGRICIDEPGAPSLTVRTRGEWPLPRRGIPARIGSDECVRIRTVIRPLLRFQRRHDLPPVVGRARARLLRAGTIGLRTPFFASVRPRINSLDFVCVFLDVFATDAAGNTSRVRMFIVLQQ